MYEKGRGVEQDYEKAVEWYQKAAEQGNKDAQSNLEALRKELNTMPESRNTTKPTCSSSSAYCYAGVAMENLRTINNANIRSCGKDSCDSLGLIPQGATTPMGSATTGRKTNLYKVISPLP